jgi:hypothetical protein
MRMGDSQCSLGRQNVGSNDNEGGAENREDPYHALYMKEELETEDPFLPCMMHGVLDRIRV